MAELRAVNPTLVAFPVPDVPVTFHTPSMSVINIWITKLAGAPNLLSNCFIIAMTTAQNMTTALWLLGGFNITFTRCQVVMQYTGADGNIMSLSTRFFHVVNAAVDFQHIVDNIESWDDALFNAATEIHFIITLQFDRVAIPPPQMQLRPRAPRVPPPAPRGGRGRGIGRGGREGREGREGRGGRVAAPVAAHHPVVVAPVLPLQRGQRQAQERAQRLLRRNMAAPVAVQVPEPAPAAHPVVGRPLRNVVNGAPRGQFVQNLLSGRQYRSGPRPRVGSRYTDLKKRMHHKRGIEDFYFMTDSIMNVPHTEDEFCFPMAFIKCQMRTVTAAGIVETKGKSTMKLFADCLENTCWMEESDIYDPFYLPNSEALLGHPASVDLLKTHREGDWTRAYHLPFNPFKGKKEVHEDGFVEYYADRSFEYNQAWYVVAFDIFLQVTFQIYSTFCLYTKFLLMQVENSVGDYLDWTDEEIIFQAYANFFRVHIHTYTLIGQGVRNKTYFPLTFADKGRHVHMVIDNEHCYPITHVRHFMAKTSGSGSMSVHNFCDYCTYTTNDSINRETMMKHICKCIEKNQECKNYCIEEFERNMTVNTYEAFHKEEWKQCLTCGFNGRKRPAGCREHHIQYYQKFICSCCKDEVEPADIGTHLCYIPIPKIKDKIEDSDLWVYDIEAMQFSVGALIQGDRETPLNAFQHQCNLVCLKRMYSDNEQYEFETIESFCDFIMTSDIFDNAVIIAHNGGGYDHQYVLRYCEARSITHSTVPHPASKHRFLSLEVITHLGKVRKFIDSMAFITGSLRKIGQDFGLTISKGDFPHNFSRPENQDYEGRIPPIDSVEDYFCINSKRCIEEVEEMKAWHALESTKHCTCPVSIEYDNPLFLRCGGCNKDLWVFQDKLREYCWLDVDVLAEVCKKYRLVMLTPSPPEEAEEGWNYPGLDPFALLTMSQIGITAFMNGHMEPTPLFNSQFSERAGYNSKSNQWIYDLSQRLPENTFIYKGNSLREWYCLETQSYYPGYCPETKTVYLFHDCHHQSCQMCFEVTDESKKKENKRLSDYFQLSVHYRVVEIWEHEFDALTHQVENRRIMEDRSFFYGGRTEVFSPYMASTPDQEVKYYDVTSLYPTVCAGGGNEEGERSFDLPTGDPIITHNPPIGTLKDIWGFVCVDVIPNKLDLLGLLPGRDEETKRLQFTLYDQTGCWHTEELNLAVENGYVVTKIHQSFHWPEDRRSNKFMRGYVAFFLRMKQEADGWKKAGASSEEPSDEEKDIVINSLWISNGRIARMRKDLVQKNPVKRQIAKLFLNSLWGKYAQMKQDDFFLTVNGYQQYISLINHPHVCKENMTFRHVKDNVFKVRYQKTTGFQTPNMRYNIFLAASVTAHARCYLHRKMLAIGPKNIGYCDTDSLITLTPREGPDRLVAGVGLGKWTDEYPDKQIECVFALAPKSYNIFFYGGYNTLKSKGVSLTLANQAKVHFELMESMLESTFFVGKGDMPKVSLDHMNINSNSHYTQIPYATLMTTYSEKIMRPVLTKRDIVFYDREDRKYPELAQRFERLYTIPKGFKGSSEEVSAYIRRCFSQDFGAVVDCALFEN